MHVPLLFSLFVLCFGQAIGQEGPWSERSRLMPDRLRDLPVGLTLYHTPNPNYPEPNTDPSPKATKYVWKHATCVRSEVGPLTVVAAGSFIWYGPERGWKENMQLDRKKFSRSFNCPKGLLEGSQTYCYDDNYRYGNQLFAGDALWFIIAEDAQGKRYKGTGLIETEATLLKEHTTASQTGQTWKAQPQKSQLSWTGYGAIGEYSLTGTVKLAKGSLSMEAEKVTGGQFVIDLKTLQHSSEDLLRHLHDKDFFHTKRYPTATFELDHIVDGLAKGQLTIKGKTQPIEFPVTLAQSTEALVVKGTAVFDRTKFDIQYRSPSYFPDLGSKGIRDDVQLAFELHFSPQ